MILIAATAQVATVILLLLQICSVQGQISSSARLQPWPLHVQSSGMCCTERSTTADISNPASIINSGHGDNHKSVIDDPMRLLKCVNSSTSMVIKDSAVAIITYVHEETDVDKHFAVPDIMTFAAYHAAVTAAYAEHNGYMYRFITPDMPIGYPSLLEPADVRWNKVKLLIDALDPQKGWARHVKYIAWIDADAIILDMGMRLEDIMESQYPQADLLASADIRQGYINSGFLLVRNTPWAREFLQRWWDVADRRSVCDQDAFDAIYTEYSRDSTGGSNSRKGVTASSGTDDVATKVMVLRRDALNTDPPATLRQQPSNQVLHLMGESSAFRADVFQRAFLAICDARTGGVLPAQMGLYRNRLGELAVEFYRAETAVLLEAAQTAADQILPTFIDTDSKDSIPKGNDDAGVAQTVDAEDSKSAVGAGQEKALFRSDRDLFKDISLVLQAPTRFEHLGRAAHHLCDLLAAPFSSPGRQDEHARRVEAYELRTRIFSLAFKWLEKGHAALRLLNSRIDDNAQVGGSSGGPMSKILERQRVDKSLLVSALLQLLKRAAEAGNDVFGASLEVDQKRVAADKTFQILRELHARVDRQSQAVPAHMQALMHQNMAYMEFELAAALLAQLPEHEMDLNYDEKEGRVSDGARTAEDAAFDAETPQFSKANRLRASQTRKLSAQRSEHLQSARSHAEQSVQLFNEYLPPTQTAERSIVGEHIHSLQILAAVHCSAGLNITRGMLVWEQAIQLSGDNMRGVLMGAPLDLYGGILHNAAVCHWQAAGRARSQAQAHANKMPDVEEESAVLERALLLAKEAVAARALYSKQHGLPHDKSTVDAVNNNLLHISHELLATIEKKMGEVGSRSTGRMPRDPFSHRNDIKSPPNGPKSAGLVDSNSNVVYTEADFDESEWEECVEGEDGCEAFLVTDTASAAPIASVGAVASASKSSDSFTRDARRSGAADIRNGWDNSAGIGELRGLSRSSQGLDETLDSLDLFMKSLGEHGELAGAGVGQRVEPASDARSCASRHAGISSSSAAEAICEPVGTSAKVAASASRAGKDGPAVDVANVQRERDRPDWESSEEADDEWEECEFGEAGCAASVVDGDDELGQKADVTIGTHDVNANGDDEWDDGDALTHARELWARQTASFRTMRGPSP